MHADDEQIERFLHGELEPAQRSSLREHLAACADCRGRVAQARQEEEEAHALLRRLDHPLPKIAAEAVIAKARKRGLVWARRAAAILLAMSAGSAAYAVPGSPLPAWVREIVDRVGGRPEPVPATVAPALAPDGAGIALDPGDDLAILFTANQAVGSASIRLTDDPEVRIRALGGTATFTSELDRLVVANHGSTASFDIDIPRAAPRVEVRVAGRTLFLKQGARVSTDSSPDAAGRYRLPLSGTAR